MGELAVAQLREENGGDLHLIGSRQLAQSLARYDLIDEYQPD